jgi:hypothetical protein
MNFQILFFEIKMKNLQLIYFLFQCGPIIEGNMITMECQPGGHGAHLGHSMMMDPTSGSMHHQEQEHKKKRK